MKWLYQLRRDYGSFELSKKDLNKNPIKEFEKWFKRAVKTEQYEPNAMAMATSSSNGRPSVRYVLLKNFDPNGFVFYTHYESRKSEEINENPYGSFVFFWPVLQQQIRVEGRIVKLSNEESDKYFDNRPQGSKIGAWASPQSKPIHSREYLENIKNDFELKYKDNSIPRPDYWGGYRIIPNRVEFWQGRKNRLHDRFEYLVDGSEWKIQRLAP